MAMRVIGAGLPRTGTLSLKFALEKLGFGRCYHMTELLLHPEHAELWSAAADGAPDWDRLLQGYQSTTDFPGCFFWQSLLDHYPDAKVVLSVRTPESWYDSVSQTVGSPEHQADLTKTPIGPFMIKMFGSRSTDRDEMIAGFTAHVEAVKNAVPADRLLVFEAKQGWEPLCAFLGVPVPDSPYPRVNSRDDASQLINQHRDMTDFAGVQADIRRMLEEIGRGSS